MEERSDPTSIPEGTMHAKMHDGRAEMKLPRSMLAASSSDSSLHCAGAPQTSNKLSVFSSRHSEAPSAAFAYLREIRVRREALLSQPRGLAHLRLGGALLANFGAGRAHHSARCAEGAPLALGLTRAGVRPGSAVHAQAGASRHGPTEVEEKRS